MADMKTEDSCLLKQHRAAKRRVDKNNSATPKSKKGKHQECSSSPVLGWCLNLPPSNNLLQFRDRAELLNLLDRVNHIIKDKKCDSEEQLEYLLRLNRKIKYRMSSFNVLSICACPKMSLSCMGIVEGPPLSMELIHCSYTDRSLLPVIFQTFDIQAPWLKVKEELFEVAKSKGANLSDDLVMIRRPLTFAYITSAHLPAIKCLIDIYFWANVDLSLITQYPEFSCIVLYGKLVVGFGFLSPGAHRNEGYINYLFVRPHWRRSGIGAMILYSLRQQCLFWTLTLHVSPCSEALNLYHKFSFKSCYRIKNFYDGYMLSPTPGAKDALFMKLESRLPQLY